VGEDESYEEGYSKQARQRIAEAPDDIAAALGLPRARCVGLHCLCCRLTVFHCRFEC
jgi:hypothetical protein